MAGKPYTSNRIIAYRQQILDSLQGKELNIKEILTAINVKSSYASITFHMLALEEAKCIERSRKRGLSYLYKALQTKYKPKIVYDAPSTKNVVGVTRISSDDYHTKGYAPKRCVWTGCSMGIAN